MKTFPPKTGNFCFGCGADNPLGLKLSFEGDPNSGCVSADFQPQPFMAGGIDTMHGGFIALLLDEVSSKVLTVLGKQGVTRNIDVSYEKTIALSRPLKLEANLVQEEGRKHVIDARILNLEGDILAKSKALFLVFGSRR
jgi:acyl-coenzyme A thioesterase PaaI-like protein